MQLQLIAFFLATSVALKPRNPISQRPENSKIQKGLLVRLEARKALVGVAAGEAAFTDAKLRDSLPGGHRSRRAGVWVGDEEGAGPGLGEGAGRRVVDVWGC